ncbi:MAG: type III-B CRISPR module RAMP protein Cmr6, partial [Candidatus Sericytochromatia bacterium]|nr:type III-B CRISPR module RAMP protein Cmr6 [Candidatus Tanganyikabacteria bacterium]
MRAIAVTRNVQDLLGKDGRDVPPGHAFSLYFPYWTARWEAAKEEKGSALRGLRELPPNSRKLLRALADRQVDLAVERGALLKVAVAMSPLATGLGMEHPVDNGFAFLSPYGLPYLAGSGVKGVMRRAAEELANGLADEPPADDLTGEDIAVLFGREIEPACRGALVFWDVFPVADTMAVEVMTPHNSDYYTGKAAPHDASQPNPIPFLAVAADADFSFVVECRRALP